MPLLLASVLMDFSVALLPAAPTEARKSLFVVSIDALTMPLATGQLWLCVNTEFRDSLNTTWSSFLVLKAIALNWHAWSPLNVLDLRAIASARLSASLGYCASMAAFTYVQAQREECKHW